jgi:hypothetical protein
MYLVLRPPWGGGGSEPASSDAGTVATAPADAGVKPKKKRPRRPGPRTPGEPVETEDTEPVELGAGDRALEWRGDAVALPAQSIDMAGGGEARPLEDGEINATVGSQTGGVRECVVAGATGTDLRATITIKLVVDGNGRVTKSRLQAPRYLFEKGLLGCAQRSLSRMRFPATGAPTLVTFPVNLG